MLLLILLDQLILQSRGVLIRLKEANMVAPVLLRQLRVTVVLVVRPRAALWVGRYKLLVITKYHLFAGDEDPGFHVLTSLVWRSTLDQFF